MVFKLKAPRSCINFSWKLFQFWWDEPFEDALKCSISAKRANKNVLGKKRKNPFKKKYCNVSIEPCEQLRHCIITRCDRMYNFLRICLRLHTFFDLTDNKSTYSSRKSWNSFCDRSARSSRTWAVPVVRSATSILIKVCCDQLSHMEKFGAKIS